MQTLRPDHPIHVAARVRPPLPADIENGEFNRSVGTTAARRTTIHVTTEDKPVLVDANGAPSGDVRHLKSFELNEIFDEKDDTMRVYENCVQNSVRSAIDGINSTVFAYGQSGSGKTHTMFGSNDATGMGLVSLALQEVLADARCTVAISFLQVYGTALTDLLEDAATPLKLVDVEGDVHVAGLSRHAVTTPAQALALLSSGFARRRTRATGLNDESSRSHAIVTVYVSRPAATDEQDETLLTSKLHMVDLAGSERTKESAVEGTALKEATQINSSLLVLIRVVRALAERAKGGGGGRGRGAHIPYRDDRLTHLLRDALGGNCRTSLIATVSPAQRHAAETAATLSFARTCLGVVNSASVNRTTRQQQMERPWASAPAAPSVAAVRKEANAAGRRDARRLPWAGMVAGGEGCPGGRIRITTAPEGVELSALAYGSRDAPRGLALCLHGYPSSAESCYDDWLLPALVTSGYYAVALDMPGCGESGGAPLRTRSEFCLAQNGPASLAHGVIRGLGFAKATLIGHDWGGGTALAMAHSPAHRKAVAAVIVQHASFNEVERDELLRVQCPVGVLWCKEDQFHAWPHWKPLATKLQKALGPKRSMLHLVGRRADAEWQPAARERAIIRFLTGVDPLPGASGACVVERPREEAASTKGTRVVARQNVVVHTAGLDASIFTAKDPEVEAALEFKRVALEEPERLRSMYYALTGLAAGGDSGGGGGGGGGGVAGGPASKQEALRLFGALPPLTSDSITPHRLAELGLWSEAAAEGSAALMALLGNSVRYYPGRRLVARGRMATLISCGGDGDDGGANGGGMAVVQLDSAGGSGGGGETITIPWDELLLCNQPHALPTTANGEARLEDGIRCNYTSPLAKAKMCEIALRLDAILSQRLTPLLADTEAEHAAADAAAVASIEDVQLECVQAVRAALDLVTFQRGANGEILSGDDRHRDRARYCLDDAAKFAVHGQGHCHTVSSVMAAFLAPWQAAIGVDLCYREDAAESHQWLEVTARPAMRAYALDLYRADGGSAPLLQRVDDVYTNGRAPAREPKVMCGQRIEIVPIREGDVLSAQ